MDVKVGLAELGQFAPLPRTKWLRCAGSARRGPARVGSGRRPRGAAGSGRVESQESASSRGSHAPRTPFTLHHLAEGSSYAMVSCRDAVWCAGCSSRSCETMAGEAREQKPGTAAVPAGAGSVASTRPREIGETCRRGGLGVFEEQMAFCSFGEHTRSAPLKSEK